MTDEELVDDLQRVLSAAVMRGVSIDEMEQAVDEASERVKRLKVLNEGDP